MYTQLTFLNYMTFRIISAVLMDTQLLLDVTESRLVYTRSQNFGKT
jgi:hypothetical protein